MKHLWKPFQGLRWKLTLSYTLVTVATWLVIEILFIGGFSIMLIYSDVIPGAMVYAIDTFIAPQVAEYLGQPEPDIESMKQWMESSFTDGITFESPENPSLSFHLGDLDRNAYISILDQDLIQLTGFPPSGEIKVSPQDQGIPELLQAAKMGEKTPQLISRISDGFLTTAVPVSNEDGEVLGVILMVITYPPPGSFVQALLLIGVSIILFTLAAGLVGTVFGYFTARGFTGRLKRISSAANSWSRGDFSAFIQDRSEDELGQLSQQLNRMAEQLQQLLKTKEDLATLEERNRLARDLHDSVKQQVFATTMQIGAAKAMLGQDMDKTMMHMDQAEELSRQAQSELGTLIRELRPVTLSEAGFIPALREYASDWAQHNAIEVELAVSETPGMDKQVEQALFRITQEALANVSRHSQATSVKIELSGINSEIVLSISDDGIGFDMPEVSDTGMGLANMRERMRSVGGQLEIDRQPGGGTRITAKLEGDQ
jgi:NarL family two-component system sensor histidine kinase LiaS